MTEFYHVGSFPTDAPVFTGGIDFRERPKCFFCDTTLPLKPKTLLDAVAINHGCCPACWEREHD
jgi:hypothetical protein